MGDILMYTHTTHGAEEPSRAQGVVQGINIWYEVDLLPLACNAISFFISISLSLSLSLSLSSLFLFFFLSLYGSTPKKLFKCVCYMTKC